MILIFVNSKPEKVDLMRELVGKFTDYVNHGIEIGENTTFASSNKEIDNIVITGLGGSGIGGVVVSQLVRNRCNVPIITNNSYTLPSFIDDSTLVIACSHSGNTEETLIALKGAQEANCEIACITSGGKLKNIADENNYNNIIIPDGRSPRAMFPYSVVALIYTLNKYNLITNDILKELVSSVEFLRSHEVECEQIGTNLANNIFNKQVMIYADSEYNGAVTRYRQQLNENAKILASHHVYPEMNHNELVGWAGGNNEAVVTFRTPFDFERTSLRMDICKEIITKKTNSFYEIDIKGDSFLEATLYLVLVGDWCSVVLSEKRNVDNIEVKVIDFLKSELSKR